MEHAMLKPHQRCSSCGYWRPGASASTDIPARATPYEEMGVCENAIPMVFLINDGPVTLQPMMHRSRCCADWAPIPDDDDPDDEGPDGPDDGEPHPVTSRVRHLFPIKPAPIAA